MAPYGNDKTRCTVEKVANKQEISLQLLRDNLTRNAGADPLDRLVPFLEVPSC